jgi:hypothetical protein
MYALGLEGNVATTNSLYTFYSVINRLFRQTICPRDGDHIVVMRVIKHPRHTYRGFGSAF